jgi:hypothetical protein
MVWDVGNDPRELEQEHVSANGKTPEVDLTEKALTKRSFEEDAETDKGVAKAWNGRIQPKAESCEARTKDWA